MDLALARLYLPADVPVVLDPRAGELDPKVSFDARDEVRADLTGEVEDLVLVKRGEREPVTRIPRLTAQLSDLTYRSEQLRVGGLELKGSADVRDPRARQGARTRCRRFARASPISRGRSRPRVGSTSRTAIPGGGTLAISGALRPPPAPSQLRLRLSDVDVAAWNRFVPITARLSGRGEADLRIDEPLAAGVLTRVKGSIAVNRVGVRDGSRSSSALSA